jgi:hypothetical protein
MIISRTTQFVLTQTTPACHPPGRQGATKEAFALLRLDFLPAKLARQVGGLVTLGQAKVTSH